MGLDMYLFKTKKVSGVPPEKLASIYQAFDREKYYEKEVPGLDTFLPVDKMLKLRMIYTNNEGNPFEEVGYWRKAYDVHNWFGEVFDGVENCEYYYVTPKIFSDLLQFCVDEMTNNREEHDDYDLYNFKETIKIVSDILYNTDFNNEYIYYYAWW